MQLFSGVFFPTSRLPEGFAWIVNLSPFYPTVKLARNLFSGQVGVDTLLYALWLVALAAAAYWLAVGLMHRRIIK